MLVSSKSQIQRIPKSMNLLSGFKVKPIDDYECRQIFFGERYFVVWSSSPNSDSFVMSSRRRVQRWRVDRNARYIKFYNPGCHNPKLCIENGSDVHIIFLRYRTIFKCLVRMMILKKRAKIRVKARKNLRIANLFRRVGDTNLNVRILSFIEICNKKK